VRSLVTIKRSIVEAANSTSAFSSKPTDSPKQASLEAANNNAFARAGVSGAATATTSRTNTRASAHSDTGA
jgi:hypothetical protein